MRNIVTALTSLAALSAPTVAIAADNQRTLVLSSPWNVDYARDSCALRAAFGTGPSKVILELRQYSPLDTFDAAVASAGFGGGLTAVKVRFVPNGQLRLDPSMSRQTFSNGMVGVTWLESFLPLPLKPQDPKERITERDASEKAVTGIELAGGIKPTILLATGEMHIPMNAMRKCTDELVTHWGIDAAAQRTLSKEVKPVDQMKWAQVLQNNYPPEMVAQSKSGIVRVRLIVGPDGRTTSCHIQVPSQDPSFETTTCKKLMKVSKFEPALDANGKPVASYFVTKVVFSVN